MQCGEAVFLQGLYDSRLLYSNALDWCTMAKPVMKWYAS